VEKAIGALPEEAAEDIQLETVKILKGSKHKDNLIRAERRSLQAIRASADFTGLTDSGNMMVVLNTADYNQTITAFLEDQACKELNKDCTEAVECKSVLKNSSQPQPHGRRPPRIFGFPTSTRKGSF
jgi:hypothetical protein